MLTTLLKASISYDFIYFYVFLTVFIITNFVSLFKSILFDTPRTTTTLTTIMDRATNNRQRRRNRNKKQQTPVTTATTTTPVVTQQAHVVPVEHLEQNIRRRMVEKIIDICQEYKMMVFGSYVREYMCERTFNPELSDIDIFSVCHEKALFVRILRQHGFSVNCEQEDLDGKYRTVEGKKFTVHHLTLRMMNDEFFTGKAIDIKVDFVNGIRDDQPPFDSLDFSCNAWIWDEHGIRLSRKTGTELDDLSARDIKKRELQILDDAKKFTTEYYPMDKEGQLRHMDKLSVNRRKIRIARIIKMLQRGWTIKNFDTLTQQKIDHPETCPICQDEIGDTCLTMKCCAAKYHHDCFLSYGREELSDRSFIRCTQRCSEVHL